MTNAIMQADTPPKRQKFGTFSGVFLPSVLTVLGLILYLRFGWVLGNLGLGYTLLAVLLAHSITFITGLSASAIVTNIDMGAGGAYYFVSRSLGIETGGAIGLAFYISRTLSLTFYSFGFVEILLMFWPVESWGPVPVFAPVLLTAFVILIVTLIATRSAALLLKFQIPVFVLVVLSILSLMFGTLSSGLEMPKFHPPSKVSFDQFWVVFAVFFPAVTGFLSGIGMSGDLKDPGRSIPKGILRAILMGGIVYVIVPCLFAVTALLSLEQLIQAEHGIESWTKVALFGGVLIFPAACGAILSSAMTSIMSGPRVLHSLAVDGLAPKWLAHTTKTGEPGLATWLTGSIAILAAALGDLNLIARFVTVLFLTLYVVINLVTALEKLVSEPSYRPRIDIPWYVSLFGALAALIVMYFISPIALVLALGGEAAIYIYFRKRALEQQWGDVYAGFWMRIARFALLRMNHKKISPRNWRPLILVFVRDIPSRIELVKLAASFGQNKGVLSIAKLVDSKDKDTLGRRRALQEKMMRDLKPYGLEAFCEVDVVDSLHSGILAISRGHGIAGLKTNTVMFGWSGKKESNINQLRIIRDLGLSGKNIILAKFNDHDAWKMPQHKEIHLWWGGRQNNGDLLLILAYMLRLNREWEQSEIKIQAVVDTISEQKKLSRGIQKSLEKSRILASVEVHIKGLEGFRDILRANSHNADIIFLGLKNTDPGEEAEHAEKLEDMGSNAQTVVFVQNNSLKNTLPALLS
ncbi:MAG: amino acid permease [Bacteroidetes bacterium]|nr:amino acid permease [Bacteroidota bacterium]